MVAASYQSEQMKTYTYEFCLAADQNHLQPMASANTGAIQAFNSSAPIQLAEIAAGTILTVWQYRYCVYTTVTILMDLNVRIRAKFISPKKS